MVTIFDVLTVTCFVGLVLAFFRFTDQQSRTLWHFVIAGVVFAIANQVGNAGSVVLGGMLVLAGLGYVVLSVRR